MAELASLGAALCWAVAITLFGEVGPALPAGLMNLLRLVIAALVLGAVMLAGGEALPPGGLPGAALGWLLLSGVVGLGLGDNALFHALRRLGARLSLLLWTLVPPATALLAAAALGEPFTGRMALGMVVTLSGVAWVMQERAAPEDLPEAAPAPPPAAPEELPEAAPAPPPAAAPRTASAPPPAAAPADLPEAAPESSPAAAPRAASELPPAVAPQAAPGGRDASSAGRGGAAVVASAGFGQLALGIGLGVTAVGCQAVANIAVKLGGEGLPSLLVTELRLLAAVVALGVVSGGQLGRVRQLSRSTLGLVLIASLVGSALGVWLSVYGLQGADAGVAATLSSTAPIFVLPIARFCLGEKVSLRAVVGALVAVAGVTLLAAG